MCPAHVVTYTLVSHTACSQAIQYIYIYVYTYISERVYLYTQVLTCGSEVHKRNHNRETALAYLSIYMCIICLICVLRKKYTNTRNIYKTVAILFARSEIFSMPPSQCARAMSVVHMCPAAVLIETSVFRKFSSFFDCAESKAHIGDIVLWTLHVQTDFAWTLLWGIEEAVQKIEYCPHIIVGLYFHCDYIANV